MRSVFFFWLCLALSIDSSLSQSVTQFINSTSNPRIGITVIADGKPVNQQTGLKIDTKHLVFKALLDTMANDNYKNFKPELLVQNMEVILARDSRKIAKVDIENGQFADKLGGEARPEDHLVVKFTLVAQKEDGALVQLPEEALYNFILRK